MEWLKDIKPDDLPENYREMLGVIIENVHDEIMALHCIVGLATHYNKQGFYFSGIDAVVNRKKREYVLANRGRKKVSELARATGFAERTIYEIYEEVAKKKQTDMFDAK